MITQDFQDNLRRRLRMPIDLNYAKVLTIVRACNTVAVFCRRVLFVGVRQTAGSEIDQTEATFLQP